MFFRSRNSRIGKNYAGIPRSLRLSFIRFGDPGAEHGDIIDICIANGNGATHEEPCYGHFELEYTYFEEGRPQLRFGVCMHGPSDDNIVRKGLQGKEIFLAKFREL